MGGDLLVGRSLFSSSGRLGRIRYIAWVLVAVAVASLFLGFFASLAGSFQSQALIGVFKVALILVAYLALPVVWIVMSMRRLHDIGRPGWLAALLLVPVINVVLLAVLVLWPGEPQSNAYGDPSPEATGGLRLAGMVVIAAIVMLYAYGNTVPQPVFHSENPAPLLLTLEPYSP